MLIFDIDDTLSPTRPPKDWAVPHETERAFGFEIKIPTYVLDFLRSRDDIALLSTWDAAAQQLADAFKFSAKVLIMDGDAFGIKGKYQVVQSRNDVVAWVDDHITPLMRLGAQERGISIIKPKKGCISEKEIQTLRTL